VAVSLQFLFNPASRNAEHFREAATSGGAQMNRDRYLVVAVKLLLLVAGLWFLLRPEAPAPNAAYHQDQVLAKAAGGLLLLIASVPFRLPRRDVNDAPEEL
jgi:hypothetical protein